MKLARDALLLLGLAVLLAALRHIALWEPSVRAPGALIEEIAAMPAITEWPPARALAAFEAGTHQPVDLRRDAKAPFVAGQIAWQLPLPHSLRIFARYRENAKAATKPLVFLVDAGGREDGARVAKSVCEDLDRRAAVLVVGGL